ncbi:hypothetical protein AGMMS49944_04800 [Spirochaetia bacterium]|nr:hypothetical protein AGMMS49944_04800 [Spirochaetia bacterium]
MEPESLIDKTISELAEKLRGHKDAAVLLRRLFDGLCAKLLEHTATDHITAANAVLEVIDEDTGSLYRRYLELIYGENDNGIRLQGENLAGEKTGIVFLSDTALKKMRDLRGAGADKPRCKED